MTNTNTKHVSFYAPKYVLIAMKIIYGTSIETSKCDPSKIVPLRTLKIREDNVLRLTA